jgi:uncharacterized phage protein (TIGR02218 family)
MTRTVGANLLVNAQSKAPTLAWAIIVTRQDATVYRWTTHDRDVSIAGNTYSSEPGIDVRQLVMTAGFAVDNTECEILATDVITKDDMIAGLWNSAAFTLALFNWKATADGMAVFMSGTLGMLKPRLGKFVTELRDIRQSLQADTTDVVQPDCRYRLGDAKCTLDITGPPFTMTGTVTAVASRYAFTDTARTEADDWFGAGEVRFTSGLNAGLRFRVREFASDQFVFDVPTPFAITIGDAYTAIAGCRKRDEEDCRDKFDNIVNFGGEPHKARVDFVLRGAA